MLEEQSSKEQGVMPKKTNVGHKVQRRGKPTQKRVELVRLAGSSLGEKWQQRHMVEDKPPMLALANASTVMAAPVEAEEDRPTTHKGSTEVRGAPRRAIQNAQQQRASAIIDEDFTYVKRDLITIGILSSIMITAMIVLSFILGID
jgi:hypothetical protein